MKRMIEIMELLLMFVAGMSATGPGGGPDLYGLGWFVQCEKGCKIS